MTLTSCHTCHAHLAVSTPHTVRTAKLDFGGMSTQPSQYYFLIAKWQIATFMPMTSYQYQHSGAKFKENINHIHWFILVHISSGMSGDA